MTPKIDNERELKLRADEARARHAKSILEDEMVVQALTLIRKNVTEAWERSKSDDKEGREDAWRQLKALNEFERHFVSILKTGHLAEQELSLIDKAAHTVTSMFKSRRFK